MAQTTDYKQFKFLIDNRQTARNHINKLKNAIQTNPEILEVQPILVNEKMEIIDGQHRYQAASELGLPIYYSKVKGLNIATARDMNVLQRRWTVDDYAISYAKAGNDNYKKFIEYRHDYPSLSNTSLLLAMGSEDSGSRSLDFRNGKFVIGRDEAEIKWILDQLTDIRDITGGIPQSKSFVSALLQAIDNEEFDYDDFKQNLKSKPELFHRVSTVRDGLRMIEDIYNYKKSVKLIRLY